MNVSPFAQYHLRKLLSEYASHLYYSISDPSGAIAPPDIDLTQLLATLATDTEKAAPTIRELESLIQMYQTLESRLIQDTHGLGEVQRRIFRLVDLQSHLLPSCPLPIVLTESALELFSFYHNGKLQLGMHHAKMLYGFIKQLSCQQKLIAYQVGGLLMGHKIATVLTMSEDSYKLWVDLRSPTYPVLMQPRGTQALQVILFLQALLAERQRGLF